MYPLLSFLSYLYDNVLSLYFYVFFFCFVYSGLDNYQALPENHANFHMTGLHRYIIVFCNQCGLVIWKLISALLVQQLKP